MLYPKNTDTSLREDLFRNPTSEYRGTPFWAWNCELQEEELLRQLEIMKEMGLGGAHMHVRTGMATPYLSSEHMALVSSCVEKCRQEGMLAWLYDEDRWPSGAAGGLLTKDPQYRARQLLFTPFPYSRNSRQNANTEMSGKSIRSNNGQLLACYDVVLDEGGCLSSARRIGPEEPAAGTKWYAYLETPPCNPWYNNQTYANTLDPKTMRRFIEITYNRYLEAVGRDFGGVVPAIFTDEPQFTRKQTLGFAAEQKDVLLPWTEDVPETFREAFGEDLMAHLPELFWELPEGQVSRIRYHYHDHIAERFAAAFADQCGAWCRDHNLMLTGHMMEEPTLFSQTAALGEAMRSYRSFQLPGIDMLCDRCEFTTAKQAQSAARQYGRPGVLSELYGVTGWNFDFRGHKFQGDWQAALGITVRVHHLTWVSMKGEAKRDYPASIGYQSPWWQDYRFVEDHFARVNTALTRGKALARIGVIHPVESYWLHWGPSEQTAGIRGQLDANFQNLTDWLLTGCQDFDFISESLLPQQCPTASAPLQVGAMAYDVILVPACETLRSSTLQRLEAFRAAGGRLIFLGDAPRLTDAIPDDRGATLWAAAEHISFSREALLEALEPVRLVDVRNADGQRTSNLLYQLREDGSRRWLFLAHSARPVNPDASNPQPLRITLEGAWGVRLYDTQTGQIRSIPHSVSGGKTVIHTTLHAYDSLLLCCEAALMQTEAVQPPAPAFSRRLRMPKLADYTLEEPNVLLLDKAEFALNDEPWEPEEELLRADNVLRARLGWPSRRGAVAQPWTVQEEAPPHKVRLRFTVPCAVDGLETKLALEDAGLADIRCNGQPVAAKSEGWFTDKCIGTIPLPPLQKGNNRIEVTLPFGRRTNVEWCYLLGSFGVELRGEYRRLVPLPEQLGFDDVTRELLPHYGSNITWHLPFSSEGQAFRLTVPHYDGAALRIAVDGAKKGYIAYPPYMLELGELPAGDHTLQVTLLGTRQNCFGPVHCADETETWIGPDIWRTEGNRWTDSYRLRRMGLRTAPILEATEPQED